MKSFHTILVFIILFFSLQDYASAERFKWRQYGYDIWPIESAYYNPITDKLYGIGKIRDNRTNESNWYMFMSADSGRSWMFRNKINIPSGYSEYLTHLRIGEDGTIYLYGLYEYSLLVSNDDGYYFETFYGSYIGGIFKNYFVDSEGDIVLIINSDDVIYDEDMPVFYSHTYIKWITKEGIVYYKDDYKRGQWKHYLSKYDNKLYILTWPRDYRVSWMDTTELMPCNKLYIFDKELKKIDSTFLSDYYQKNNIILSLTEDNENLYFLLAEHRLIDAPDNYKDLYSNAIVLKIDKKSNSREEIALNLPEYNVLDNVKFFKEDKIGFILGNDNKFQVFWKDSVYLFNHDLQKEKHSYHFPYNSSYKTFNFTKNNSNNIIIYSDFEYNVYVSAYTGAPYIGAGYNSRKDYPVTNVCTRKDSSLIIVDSSGAVFSTSDKGLHWNDLTSNLRINYRMTSIVATDNGNLIAGTQSKGLLYLNDEGGWEFRNDGLTFHRINKLEKMQDGRILILADNGLFVSSADLKHIKKISSISSKEAVFTNNGIYLVTKDGKLKFFEISDDDFYYRYELLKDCFVTSIALSEKGIFLASALKKGIYKSSDYGKSWSPANFHLYSEDIYQVVSLGKDNFIACGKYGMYYTNCNGDGWEENGYPLPFQDKHYYNPDDGYKISGTGTGEFFLITHGSYYYLNGINSEQLEYKSGWIKDGKGITQIYKISNYYKALALEEKDIYYTFARDTLIKYELSSGRILWKRYFKNLFIQADGYDFDKTGKLLAFMANIGNKNGAMLYLYDIEKDSIINVVQLTDNPRVYVESGKITFDNLRKEIVLCPFMEDSTLSVNGLATGGIIYYDYSGKRIRAEENFVASNLNFSPDYTCMYFEKREIIKTSDSTWGHQLQVNYLLDLRNGRSIILDTTGQYEWRQYQPLGISPDNSLLLFRNAIAFISETDSNNYLKVHPLDYTFYRLAFLDNDNVFGELNYEDYYIKFNIPSNTIKCRGFPNANYHANFSLMEDRKRLMIYSPNLVIAGLDELLTYIELDFTASDTSVYVDENIRFSATNSEKIKSFKWDFGDGSFGIGHECLHRYEKTGNYSVKLKYITIYGDTFKIEKNKYIHVYDSLKIYSGNFEIVSISDKIPVTVRCTSNISGNFSNIYWDMGDGSQQICKSDFAYKYYKPGEYRITLIIRDSATNHKYNVDPIINVSEEVYPQLDYRYTVNDSNKIAQAVSIKPGPDGSFYLGAWEENRDIKSLYRIDKNNNTFWKREIDSSLHFSSYYDFFPTKDGGVKTITPIKRNGDLYSYKIKKISSDNTIEWEIAKGAESVTQEVISAASLDDDKLVLFMGMMPTSIFMNNDSTEECKKTYNSISIKKANILPLKNHDCIVNYQIDLLESRLQLKIINSECKDIKTVFEIFPFKLSINALGEAKNSIIVNTGYTYNSEYNPKRGLLIIYDYKNEQLPYVVIDSGAFQFNCLTMLNDSMFAVSGIYADGFIGYTVYDINLNKIERVILTTLNGGINSMYLDAKRRLHLAGYTLSNAKEFHPYVFVSKPVTYVSASDEKAGAQENDLRVYPNPAEDEFNVEYELSRGGYYKLSLINSLGLEDYILSEGQALPGKYRAEFSITEKKLTSGIYFLRLLNDKEIITEKVIILK